MDVVIAASRKDKVQDRQDFRRAAVSETRRPDHVESCASGSLSIRLIGGLPNSGTDAIVALFEIGCILRLSMQVILSGSLVRSIVIRRLAVCESDPNDRPSIWVSLRAGQKSAVAEFADDYGGNAAAVCGKYGPEISRSMQFFYQYTV